MTVTTQADPYSDAWPARPWWTFLVTGVAWVLIALAILTIDAGSPRVIAYLTGGVLILAGINELVMVVVAPGLRWLHLLVGLLFAVIGLLPFFEPYQTFGTLAVLIGWYFVIKGISDCVISIVERAVLPLWGLLLTAGIAEVALGVWAIGYPGRSAWLLTVWIGLAALIRGISQIFASFGSRDSHQPRPAFT